MSSRLTRALLRLYPRRVRARYGHELLSLQDELRAHGALSRMRLIPDAIAGAFLARTVRQRVQVVTGATVLIIGLALATTILATGHDRRTPVRAASPSERAVPATSCFVDTGSTCSTTSCAQFAAQGAAENAIAYNNAPAIAPQRSPTNTRCATYPHPRYPHALLATNPNGVVTPPG